MQYVVAYAASVVVFLGLDLVWLGLVARSFYAGSNPALQSQSWRTALVPGVLLGLAATAPTT